MTEVPIIDQPISAVAPVLRRDTINPTIPATQDAFVNSVEAFFDKISDTTVNELNQVTTKIDATVSAINIVAQELSEAATIAIASGQYKGDWVVGFKTTGYSLGDNVTFTDGYNYVSKINNNLTTPITLTNTHQWNFIEAVNPNNYYLKTETYTNTEVDTLHKINNKTAKTTPVDEDLIAIADSTSSFSLKKLTWANLKATLKTYFDTLYLALTGDQTVDGVKTFSSSPIVPTPTTNTQAANKAYVDSASSKTPAGTIITFASATIPYGYLKANGALVSRTVYSALFTAIGTIFGAGDGSTTFALPDLRGYFPRGWDDGRGIDASRVFGSLQNDELKAHSHTISNFDLVGTSSGGASTWRLGGSTSTNETGGTETRPKNIALLYCIKY